MPARIDSMKESNRIDLEIECKKLFLQAQAGDQIAYQALLERIAQLLHGYLLKAMNPRIRSGERVEDLVQEILITFHQKRDLYEVDRPLLPWIFAIARHRLIDSMRAEARRPECIEWVEHFDRLASVEMPPLPDETDGGELLEGLSEQQKTILNLAKVQEMPLAEIANRYGMSLAAVKVSIHRTLKSLRAKKGDRHG